MNRELPDVQAGFRKGRGTRDQIANICWMMEKAREFQKNIYFCFIDYAKTLTVCITTNCRQFFKRWEYQTTLSASYIGDLGLIPGLGRSPGEGKCYPLQYSSLENSMDSIVHRFTKSQTRWTVHGILQAGMLEWVAFPFYRGSSQPRD